MYSIRDRAWPGGFVVEADLTYSPISVTGSSVALSVTVTKVIDVNNS
jgi:hypothetical protein